MFPLRGLHARTAIAFTVSVALTVGGSMALATGASAAPVHRTGLATRLIASDNMHRRVSDGLGRAGHGGRYAVSSTRGARVRNHRAVLGPVAPGHQLSAWLPRLRVYNTRARTSFRLVDHHGLGGGEYFELGVRRYSSRNVYLAKVHLVPGRGVFVGVSRVRRNTETLLTSERQVLPASAMHGWLDVQAVALGTSPVRLGVRVWRAGHAKPAHDQLSYTDHSAGRIRRSGSVTFQSYLSRSASGSSVVDFRHVRVWRQHHGVSRRHHPAPPTTTPPTTTPPTTTPPTTTPPTTTPPVTGSAADAGAAPIGQASYAVPSGAVFVSPDGSDTATGTQADPLRTLGKALSEAPSGGTIVLRAGNYHESVQDNTKPVTVQNYPGEAVWLDGSSVVTGWTQHGSTWIHTGWTAQFNSVPSYTGTVSTAPGWSFINSAHPMAANPDQMWLDGSPLVQVGSAADVGPGEFFADYADDELVIGNNPASHELRASDLGVALTSYAPNVTIRGIGIRRYATAVNQFGALRLLGKSDAVSNVISTENATTGVMLGAVDETVDHVTVTANGMLGLTGTYVDGLVVDGLLAEGNNTEGFNLSPVSGGMKIARTRGVTVENSQFVDNTGPGAWFDESVYNATVVGNVMADNVGHGMSYEISSTALIADNVVENNGGDGFKINDSDHVRIWNNTITGNGRDMEIVEDLRRGANLSDPGHNPHVAQPDPTEPWIIQNDSVMNNVFSPAANTYQLYVNDYSKQYTADQLDLDVDGNQFVRGTSTPMIVWGQGAANPKLFTTAAAFVSGTGQGSANVDVSAGQTQASGPEGVALPADIAQLLGQPAGTQHVGAF